MLDSQIGENVFKYSIIPVPKPRMTRRDKWAKRPSVLRYLFFKDECKRLQLKVPKAYSEIIFKLKMPAGWPKKKKEQFNNKPHMQTPDLDNLLKALLDAVYTDDSAVWNIKVSKLWAYEGEIIIKEVKDE